MPDTQQDPFLQPDSELGRVCRELIESGTKLTIRSIAREIGVAHTTLSRDQNRREQIDRCVQLQKTVQLVSNNYKGRIRPEESEDLAKAKMRISELEKQNDILIASHKAMILAVGKIGGLSAWRNFFTDYEHIIDGLVGLGAMPDNVQSISE